MSTILMCFFQTFFYFLMFFVDISKRVVYHIRKGGIEMFGKRIENCGKRIEIALAIRNMKQCDLCRLANVPKSSLSLYLSGAYEPKQDRIYSTLISRLLSGVHWLTDILGGVLFSAFAVLGYLGVYRILKIKGYIKTAESYACYP